MYQYCVMRRDIENDPHRIPFLINDLEEDVPIKGEDEQLEWCQAWIQECVDMGFKPDTFYVARREVSVWEKF